MPIHYRACNLCEAMCGLAITVEDGRIADIRGDDQDPFSRGHICPKGPAMREIQDDPDRLRHPVRRTAGGWQRITWDEAIRETADRLAEARAEHGRDAVGIYLGNPSVHNMGTLLGAPLFMQAVGSKNRFDANSLDANPKLFACLLMYGDPTAIPIPDVDRTDYLLVLGANPAASNGSLMTLGDVRGRLKGIRERGGKMVVIDPRRTETAAWADEHHFIRPGGDAALLLGMLHTVLFEGKVDAAAVGRVADGLDALRRHVEGFAPERVAGAVGIEAGTIRRIAREFAAARTAVAYGRVGTTLNEFGPMASWLVDALNVVTGNFDRPGGMMFPTPAIELGGLARTLGVARWNRWRSRVRGLSEFGGQLPAAVMAEEMETPGPGQIRAFVTIAGNPVLSSPNGERLAAALGKLDFMVSLDLYVNETTRHAHIILPPRYALERPQYEIVFHALSVRNGARWADPVLPPGPDTRDDWDILMDLAARLARGSKGLAIKTARRISPERMIGLMLRLGRYGSWIPGRGLSIAKLRKSPHGVDLGPMVPARKEKVRTKNGLVDLVPGPIAADLQRLDRWLTDRPANGLMLIGRRHVRSNNSWMHNCTSLTKGPSRATLLMHPDDARRLALKSGAEVKVESRVGAVIATLEESDTLMPGVVSLPHGFGHAPAADTLRVAGPLAGASINNITDEARVEPLLGTAVLNGTPVKVSAIPVS